MARPTCSRSVIEIGGARQRGGRTGPLPPPRYADVDDELDVDRDALDDFFAVLALSGAGGL
jgi:hypothetical protein